MWVSREIMASNKKNNCLSFGKVIQTSRHGVCVEEDAEYRELPIVSPYGFVSIPVLGSSAVVAPMANGFLYMGTKLNNEDALNAGEVGIYSHGGASIVLKNDGRVLINGEEYAAKQKIR